MSPVNSQGYEPTDLSLPEALAGITEKKVGRLGQFDEYAAPMLAKWKPDSADILIAAAGGRTWDFDTWQAFTGCVSHDDLPEAIHRLMIAYEFPVSPTRSHPDPIGRGPISREFRPVSPVQRRITPHAPTRTFMDGPSL